MQMDLKKSMEFEHLQMAWRIWRQSAGCPAWWSAMASDFRQTMADLMIVDRL